MLDLAIELPWCSFVVNHFNSLFTVAFDKPLFILSFFHGCTAMVPSYLKALGQMQKLPISIQGTCFIPFIPNSSY